MISKNPKITGCSKKVAHLIEKFICKETDIWSYINEITIQNYSDYLIYGYNPWDYLEELKINMKLQGLT